MLKLGLYIVSTPIGNLEDITLRALSILKEVDTIACEDTRRSRVLLNCYKIKKPLISFNDHNKERRTPELIKRIKNGESIALISDAGTPGVSDPGFYLIRESIREGIEIIPIPGPSAFLSGLVVSGLPCDRFVFEGFLPKREGKKKKRLEALKYEPRTMVFYESPYRLIRTLENMLSILSNRRVAIARELTKKFEEVMRGRISELLPQLEDRRIKGEAVLIVEGYEGENKR